MDFLVRYGNYVLIPVHAIVCAILIAVVLLQTGKGADWAGAFGGGGTQTAFGPRGVENTLSRLTKIAAVVFMLTSFAISILQTRARAGGLDDLGLPASAPAKTKAAATATVAPVAAPSVVILETEAPAASPAAAPSPSEPK